MLFSLYLCLYRVVLYLRLVYLQQSTSELNFSLGNAKKHKETLHSRTQAIEVTSFTNTFREERTHFVLETATFTIVLRTNVFSAEEECVSTEDC